MVIVCLISLPLNTGNEKCIVFKYPYARLVGKISILSISTLAIFFCSASGKVGYMHYLFVPIFHDPKKDIYKVSANELVDRRALTTFHHDLSKAVENDLGYEVSIMTGETTLRREQGLRGSIDILKYKAQKLAEEYASLKDKFQGEGLKLSADMAQYIIRTGQRDQFAKFQKEKEQGMDMGGKCNER